MKFWYTDKDGGKWKKGTKEMLVAGLMSICELKKSPLVSLRFIDGSEFDKFQGVRNPENCTYNRTAKERRIDK